MLKQSADAVRYAKGFGVKVEFSAEDATRTDIEFFKQVVKAVSDAGIDRFDIPDTVGIATPQRITEYVKAARSVSDVMISMHCHNDYGMAVANSLAGVLAGAEPGARYDQRDRREVGQHLPGGVRHGLPQPLRVAHEYRLFAPLRDVQEGRSADRRRHPAEQGDRGGQRVRARVRHTHARDSEQPVDLRTLRPVDGRTDEVAAGRKARRQARGGRPAERDGAEAEGGEPATDRRQGERDGRQGHRR